MATGVRLQETEVAAAVGWPLGQPEHACIMVSMSFEFDESGRSYYVPSAFYIGAAEGVLDDSSGSPIPGAWHRLMHEYGHLIQDRTSIFGAIEFMHFYDSVQSVLHLLQAQGPTVQLPMSTGPGAGDSWLASIHALRAATNPRPQWKNGVWWAYEDYHIKQVPVSYNRAEYRIPVTVAYFVDNTNGETCEHEIGPREIKEAYSVAIEMLHGGPPVDAATTFEYLAVERILARAGEVAPRQVIAVCHWALQTPVPGVRFFQITSMLEKRGALPAADALYDLLRIDAKRTGVADLIAQIGEQLNEIVRVQSGSGVKDHLFQVLRWYRDQVAIALPRNLQPGRRFPLDTYICASGHELDDEAFTAMTTEEPIPVIETPTGAAFAFGGNSVDSESVLFIRSLGDLVGRIWFERAAAWPCVLERTCALPCRDTGCSTRPFEKGSARPPCPYGAASAYLGIPHLRVLPVP